jgi:hypothetical protein
MVHPPPFSCRRRFDRMLQTFHWACDNGEPGMAEVMLARLAAHAYEVPCLPTGVERRARVTLLGPYERLQNLLLYTGRVRWNDLPLRLDHRHAEVADPHA